MKHMNPRIISLFSGCGGMDLGFIGDFTFLEKYYPKTEFKIAYANDIDPWACATYRAYFGDHIVEGDISEIDFRALPDCEIVLGGFPCQDFSITRATNRKGIEVKRGKLYKEFVGVVKAKRPKVFVAENVKGILSANKGMAIRIIKADFENLWMEDASKTRDIMLETLGYVVKYDLWNFADYGVPQIRERVIMVGVREDIDFNYLKSPPTHKKYVSSGEALIGIENASFNNALLRIKERTRQVIASIPEGGNNDDTRDRSLYVKGIMSNIYRRLDRKKPSPTIIAAGGGGTWGYHFEEPRPLTNRERARLQSFPDSFEFIGSTVEARRQIGNAVPPVGAYAIASAVKPALYAKKRPLGDIKRLREARSFERAEQLSLL